MKSEQYFIYIKTDIAYDTSLVFHARITPRISKTDDLLKALYYSLWLPWYFGFNWDALDECIRDFEWIHLHKIVIDHIELPNIDERNLKIYLEVLRDAVLDWKRTGGHCLEVVFRETDRERIEKLLESSESYYPSK